MSHGPGKTPRETLAVIGSDERGASTTGATRRNHSAEEATAARPC
jgi:hypothetical protein